MKVAFHRSFWIKAHNAELMRPTPLIELSGTLVASNYQDEAAGTIKQLHCVNRSIPHSVKSIIRSKDFMEVVSW